MVVRLKLAESVDPLHPPVEQAMRCVYVLFVALVVFGFMYKVAIAAHVGFR
jgi:hypothetical protein